MATRLVRMIREVQPTGPYRMAGWSLGGILAYEIAAQLIGQDQGVEFVGMFDSYYPTSENIQLQDAKQEHALLLHVLRMAETEDGGGDGADVESAAEQDVDLDTFIARCRERGLLPGHVTLVQARQMRDRLRDHQRALPEYVPQPVPVAVHQFAAAESPDTDPRRGWEVVLPAAQLHAARVPGTHFSMMRTPNAQALGEALSDRIARARRGGEALSAGGQSPVLKLQGGKAGVAPLFCVPGAGTSMTSFIDLLGSVDRLWPVYGLQPRGLDGRTVPHSTVQAAAEHYLRAMDEVWPEGPVHLLGHSFGGWVALEMALRLREAGRTIGSLTILDSEVPDEEESLIREYDNREAFLKLAGVLEMTAERSFGIDPAEVDARDEAGRLELLHGKMVRHGLMNARSVPEVMAGPFRTFARCLRTTYRPSGVYPGRLRLVLVPDPRKDEETNLRELAASVRGWKRWAPALVYSAGAGNHITALKPPHVARLAGFLAEDRDA